MKRIVIYIALLLPFTSCEKYLEVEPSNVLALKTYDDVKALMGAYLRNFITPEPPSLEGTSVPYLNESIYLFWGFYSDDIDTERFLNNPMGANHRTHFIESLNWKHSSMPGVLWKEYYSNIGFLNTIVDELENVEGGTAAEKEIVRNEAIFLRAWYLFKLTQYFSPYHLDKYGIPVNLNSKKVGSFDSRRRTQKEVYEIITTELKKILSSETPPRKDYSIFNDKKLANALLAQVYHFKGGSGAGEVTDYEHAITHALAAMEGRQLLGVDDFAPFPFFEEDTYGLFKDREQALLTSVMDASNSGMFGIVNDWNLRQFARASLYALYDDNDVRKAAYFNIDANNNQFIVKFDQVTVYGAYYITVFNFFPITEMHLIIAESYARSNNEPKAKEWLEKFQRNRIRGYTGYTGNNVLQEIMDERRREFCFEYDFRWCDLIRTQTGWSRPSYRNPDEPIYTIENSDFRFCLPIPVLEELQYNKIEQNPGWSML